MKHGVLMFSKVLLATLLMPISFALAKKVVPSGPCGGICSQGTTCCEANNECRIKCPSSITLDAFKSEDGTILLRGGGKFKCLDGFPIIHLNDNAFECEKSDKIEEKKK